MTKLAVDGRTYTDPFIWLWSESIYHRLPIVQRRKIIILFMKVIEKEVHSYLGTKIFIIWLLGQVKKKMQIEIDFLSISIMYLISNHKSSPFCFNFLFPLDTDPNMTPFLHPFKNRDPPLKSATPCLDEKTFFFCTRLSRKYWG